MLGRALAYLASRCQGGLRSALAMDGRVHRSSRDSLYSYDLLLVDRWEENRHSPRKFQSRGLDFRRHYRFRAENIANLSRCRRRLP